MVGGVRQNNVSPFPAPQRRMHPVSKLLPAVSLLLALCACGHARESASGAGAIPPIRSELSGDELANHVLNRLAYGPRPGDVEALRREGVERWIARQLAPETIPDAAAETAAARYRSLNMDTRDLTAAYRQLQMARRQQQAMSPTADSMPAAARRAAAGLTQEQRASARMVQLAVPEVAAAKIARAVLSERQLHEIMVDFWENHFSVFAGKGQTRLFIASYDRDVIRPRALGNFRDLLGAVARSPAMLFYLDNWQSAADSTRETLAGGRVGAARRGVAQQGGRPRGLNENYARELMELHTLGVDGGYTQQDVVEVARALTGWSLDLREGTFVFRRAMHDAEAKTVLGTRLPAGRGVEDGERVLDLLARHPSTARHVSRKLVVRFVSDSAPPALVERCAATFTRTDGDIRETLRCVVTSPEFFSASAHRAKVKTPFELVASALRAANAAPDASPRAAQLLAQLGQPPFGRQTPDGWPDRAEEWLSSGAMVNRVNFTLAVAARRVPGITFGAPVPEPASRLSAPEFQRR